MVWQWNVAFDTLLNKKYIKWKNHAENMPQKLVPDPLFILVNNSKQPLHARNSFKNKIFWKQIIKKHKEVNFIFFFEPSPF